MMKAQLIYALAAVAETGSCLQVAQPAFAPEVETPEALSFALILAGGGLVGILGGAGLIFVLGMLSGKFYTWEEIRGALQEREIPLLGNLPSLPLLEESMDHLPILLKPNSSYLECYEKVRSNLTRIGEKPARIILITSPSQGEGKTLSSYNLAIAAARAGKRTLLIEADLRSPSACESLNLAPDIYGGVEPLQYYGGLNDCIRMVPDVERLYMIPSPGPIQQVSGVLESSEMRRLLKEARYRFDFVVVDAPALGDNNDALTLEPHTDGMVMVARPVHTSTSLLGELADRFTEEADEEDENQPYQPRLLGVIINDSDVEVELTEADLENPYIPVAPPTQLSLGSGAMPQLLSQSRVVMRK
ncbi:MAG: tyrosine-protein kinase family protein [Microcoleaceae cyanobacterium]